MVSIPTLTLTPEYGVIEPSIRETVRAINKLDIRTYSSCEGHLKISRPGKPYIIFDLKSASHEGLCTLILAVGRLNCNIDTDEWVFAPANETGNGSPFLALTTKFDGNGDKEILSSRQRQMSSLVDLIRTQKQFIPRRP